MIILFALFVSLSSYSSNTTTYNGSLDNFDIQTDQNYRGNPPKPEIIDEGIRLPETTTGGCRGSICNS